MRRHGTSWQTVDFNWVNPIKLSPAGARVSGVSRRTLRAWHSWRSRTIGIGNSTARRIGRTARSRLTTAISWVERQPDTLRSSAESMRRRPPSSMRPCAWSVTSKSPTCWPPAHWSKLARAPAPERKRRFTRQTRSGCNIRPVNAHTAVYLAQGYAAAAQPDSAIRWLERYSPVEDLHFQTHLRCDPPFDPIRRDRRFQALLRRPPRLQGTGC